MPVQIRGEDFVQVSTSEVDLAILKSDWDKIEPLILDGVFDPGALPARQPAVYLQPVVAFNEPLLDWADRPLYFRILGQLGLIFTEGFPTSDL
jgi:hypothetical protein